MNKNKIIEWLDISLEDYNNYSNISNSFFIPGKLKRFYNEEDEEQIAQCFLNIACSIYSQIDLIVGLRISWAFENSLTKENFATLISDFRKNNLKKAIYEEINFRLLSNSFPEFNNRQDLTSNNINKIGFSKDYSTIESLLSPLAAGYIINSGWNKIELESRSSNISYFDFLDKSIKRINEEVFDLKSEILKVDEKITSNSNLDQIQENLINNTKNALESQLNENIGLINRIKNNVDINNNKLQQLETAKDNVNQQLNESNSTIQTINNLVQANSSEVTAIKSNIDENTNKIRTLETTTESHKNLISTINNQNSRMSQEIGNLIQNKADKNNVYNRSEIDIRLRNVTASQTINNGDAKSANDCRKIGIFAGNFLATALPNSASSKGTIINLTTKHDSQGTFLQFFISENEKIFMRTYIDNSFTSWQQLGLMNFDGRVLKIKL